MASSNESVSALMEIFGSIQSLNKSTETATGITLVQWLFLKTLRDRPGSSPQELAEALSVHPSTLTQTLKRMKNKKFVFVTADPKDSRKKMIVLTRDGNDVLDRADVRIGSRLRSFARLAKEIEKLRGHLRTLEIG